MSSISFAAVRASRQVVAGERRSAKTGAILGFLTTLLILGVQTSTQAAEGEPAAGSVRIVRDRYGVPHIFGANNYDLFYGYGYAIAEDRLFQMEMTRRSAVGRVAEVLGAEFVEKDKAVRASYDPGAIMAAYEGLRAEDKQIFEGYVAGYNARLGEVLKDRTHLLPVEFKKFGFEPSHMTVQEALGIFIHDMALQYSTYTTELDNLRLLSKLREMHGDAEGAQIFDQLLWDIDRKSAVTISADEQTRAPLVTFGVKERLVDETLKPKDKRAALSAESSHLSRLASVSEQALQSFRTLRALRYGSEYENEAPKASLGWATNRSKTDGALAVLTDGAQMGDTTPGIVWSFGLHGPGFNVVGETQVGVPAVLFGTNGYIAWGGTAGEGDVTDLYQERLKPGDAHQYLFKGKYLPMLKRTEIINVKGQSDVSFDVYSTVHGIVSVFDVENGTAYSEKRAWQSKPLESYLGWYYSTLAKNWSEWTDQLARWALSINWEYADHEGNVGYVFTGWYPKRLKTQDFRLPAVGTGEMEWQGTLPFQDNPHVYNPKSGFVASWNNQPQPNYGSSDHMFWGPTDHVAEIQWLLASKPKVTPDDDWNVVKGVAYMNSNARHFLPMIFKAFDSAPNDSTLRATLDLLRHWNYHVLDDENATLNTAGDTILNAWLETAQTQLFEGILPEPWAKAYTQNDVLVWEAHGTHALYNALNGTESGVPQTFDFLRGKMQKEFIQETFAKTVNALSQKYGGNNPSEWRAPVRKHQFETHNHTDVPITTPDQAVSLPTWMDRGTFNFHVVFKPSGTTMCDVTPPGESALRTEEGHTSPHWHDQLELYRTFTCKPQLLTPEVIDKEEGTSQKLLRTGH